MAVWMYSVEQFPDKKARPHEFIQVLGHHIGKDDPNAKDNGIVPAKKWFKLKPKYVKLSYANYQDKQGQEMIHLAEDVRKAVEIQHGFRGIAFIEQDPYNLDNRKMVATLEKEAQEANKKYREAVVTGWERQLAVAKATGHGTFEPTAYQLECYRELGLTPPNTIQAVEERNAKQPINVTVNSVSKEEMFNQFAEWLKTMTDAEVARVRGTQAPVVNIPQFTGAEGLDEVAPILGERAPITSTVLAGPPDVVETSTVEA